MIIGVQHVKPETYTHILFQKSRKGKRKNGKVQFVSPSVTLDRQVQLSTYLLRLWRPACPNCLPKKRELTTTKSFIISSLEHTILCISYHVSIHQDNSVNVNWSARVTYHHHCSI